MSFLSHYNLDAHTLGNIFYTITAIFAVFFIFLISYSIVRIWEIQEKEEKYLRHELHEFAEHKALKESQSRDAANRSGNERWNKILAYVFSDHESDWKLAIIEADSMLDGLLDQLGFKGENIGDKLKAADRETFPDLTAAWEVHATRNRIAHEAHFDITAHEAKRVIAMYEGVFRTFGII